LLGDQRLSVAVQEREAVKDGTSAQRAGQSSGCRRRHTVRPHENCQE